MRDEVAIAAAATVASEAGLRTMPGLFPAAPLASPTNLQELHHHHYHHHRLGQEDHRQYHPETTADTFPPTDTQKARSSSCCRRRCRSDSIPTPSAAPR